MNDPRFEVYPRTREVPIDPEVPENTRTEPTGEFGWRFRDANARITFIGGEGFTSRDGAHRSIDGAVAEVVKAVVPGAEGLTIKSPPVIDVED